MAVAAGDPFLAVAPRIRLHTSPNTAVDLTPGLIVAGDLEDIGRLWVDASWMYKDGIGVGVQVDRVAQFTRTDEYPYPPLVLRRTVVRAGLRLGATPGRVGMIAQAAVVVGAVIACTRSDWC
jgi:hypothetical protein